MHVNDESAARRNDSRDMRKRLPPMIATLDHPKCAEHANGVVERVVHKAIQIDQVGAYRGYSRLAGGFSPQVFQHRLA